MGETELERVSSICRKIIERAYEVKPSIDEGLEQEEAEEKKGKINVVGEENENPVVSGAEIVCTNMENPGLKVYVLAKPPAYYNEKQGSLALRDTDTRIFPSLCFGVCKNLKTICKPLIEGERWQECSPNKINGRKGVTMNSFMVCIKGEGVITPKTDGQVVGEGKTVKVSIKEASLKAAALVYSFEGSSYTKLSGNFDGQGFSFGLLQWNFGQGTLQPLLISMNVEYKDILMDIFGDEKYSVLVDILSNDINEQLNWAKGLNDINNKICPEWSEKFIELGESKEFQLIQLEAQETYMEQAKKIFYDFGLSTERGFALALDIAVQNWSIKAGSSIVNDNMSESEKLEIMANSVAEQSASKWREDVRNRKLTIVNGVGTVHGKNYDLASEYDIQNREVDIEGEE